MTEVEKRENETLKKCLKQAYGYSDEQLRKEMEEAEQSLNDSDFPGAEERLYQKIMEREAREKKASAIDTSDRKKVVRPGKKRIFLVAILAAAFVGLLGLTAVGEKSYFFRTREKKTGTVFNNGENVKETSDINSAYQEIEKELGIKVLKLGYMPEKMEMEELLIQDNGAEICFDYQGNSIHFLQVRKTTESSIGINSDRSEGKVIWNDWIKKKIIYGENELSEKRIEREGYVTVNEVVYHISGIMELEEFTKIIENLTFY